MEKNGQINYICYLCSKFYFSQFSEKWKDYIFILWYCRSLLLSSFSITSFFEIFIRKKTSVEKNYPKIDIKSTRTRCKICSKLTIKTPGLFFIVDSEHVLVCWVVTLFFIVWVIFIIIILISLSSWFAEKLEFGVHCEISLGVSHMSIFAHNGS